MRQLLSMLVEKPIAVLEAENKKRNGPAKKSFTDGIINTFWQLISLRKNWIGTKNLSTTSFGSWKKKGGIQHVIWKEEMKHLLYRMLHRRKYAIWCGVHHKRKRRFPKDSHRTCICPKCFRVPANCLGNSRSAWKRRKQINIAFHSRPNCDPKKIWIFHTDSWTCLSIAPILLVLKDVRGMLVLLNIL